MTNIIYQNPKVESVWRQAALDTSSNPGYSRIVLPNGAVFSMQPGGVSGDRPAGTDGPWEQGKRSGNVVVYTTGDGTESWPVLIAER